MNHEKVLQDGSILTAPRGFLASHDVPACWSASATYRLHEDPAQEATNDGSKVKLLPDKLQQAHSHTQNHKREFESWVSLVWKSSFPRRDA